MPRTLCGVMLIVGLLLVGCNGSGSPAAGGTPTKVAFDPGLQLKWPGKPEEETGVAASNGGEIKTYLARFVDKSKDGVIIFHATVDEYPAAVLKDTSITELMQAKVFAFRDYEVSRKEIKHGPAGHPGLDIFTRRDGISTRKLLVTAGSRVYELSATTKKEELLKSARVADFFDSLALGK